MITLWNIPQLKLLLKEKDVHIWRADLDLSTVGFQKLYQTLSIDEKKRAERFHFEKDRRRFIVGRGILRAILGYYLSIEPSLVHFCYGKHGKPALTDTFGNGTIHFNMSHSQGVALFAFTRDHQIGVDIEHIRDIPEMDQIAEQFFSIAEKNVFRTLPKSKKKEAFFSCWTRKEAFVKSIGDGFTRPLDTFEISMAPGESARLLSIEGDKKGSSRWFIEDLRPAPGYAAAFAIERRSCELHCYQWPHQSGRNYDHLARTG